MDAQRPTKLQWADLLRSVIPTGMADFLFRSRTANVDHEARFLRPACFTGTEGPWQHVKSYPAQRGRRSLSTGAGGRPIALATVRTGSLETSASDNAPAESGTRNKRNSVS